MLNYQYPLKIRKNASKGEANEINKNSNSDITVISKEIKVIKGSEKDKKEIQK